MRISSIWMAVGWLLATGAGAQVWSEVADASSFPDLTAQQTRGWGHLELLTGSTNAGGGDLRDAFCLRIAEPGEFWDYRESVQ